MLFVSNYVIFLIIELAKSNFYYLKVLLSGKSFLFPYSRGCWTSLSWGRVTTARAKNVWKTPLVFSGHQSFLLRIIQAYPSGPMRWTRGVRYVGPEGYAFSTAIPWAESKTQQIVMFARQKYFLFQQDACSRKSMKNRRIHILIKGGIETLYSFHA